MFKPSQPGLLQTSCPALTLRQPLLHPIRVPFSRCLPPHLNDHATPQDNNSQAPSSSSSSSSSETGPSAADQHHLQQLPLVWCQGLWTGTFVNEVQQAFPSVDWQPQDLLRVLYTALPAGAAAVGINNQLVRWLTSQPSIAVTTSSNSNTILDAAGPGPEPSAAISTATAAAAAAAAAAATSRTTQLAQLHLSQEAVLAVLLTAACRAALGPRVTAAEWNSYWFLQTLATCTLLFPLVDPLLWRLWQPAAEVLFGPAPSNPLVDTLHQAGAQQDWAAIGQHCLASGVLGPAWEEVFWRGFFLTALTKVLPLPLCVGLSSFNFAALHLSPHNFLPLLVLGACCDCLYVRSGGNLLAPLLLHSLWNTSQVLQIALLGKDVFV